jgi:hypothetical protein
MYLIDPEFHVFVRSFLSLLSLDSYGELEKQGAAWTDEASSENGDLTLRLSQFTLVFLFDIILHLDAQEMQNLSMEATVAALEYHFDNFPLCATWFLRSVVTGIDINWDGMVGKEYVEGRQCSWFTDYLMQCRNPFAREVFVQILVKAVCVLDNDLSLSFSHSLTVDVMERLRGLSEQEISDQITSWSIAPSDSAVLLCVCLVRRIAEAVLKVEQHIHASDQLFGLIHDLAVSMPGLAELFRSAGLLSLLYNCLVPKHALIGTSRVFETVGGDGNQPNNKINADGNDIGIYDHHDLLSARKAVFGAATALLGVSELREVPLLTRRQRKMLITTQTSPHMMCTGKQLTEGMTYIITSIFQEICCDVQTLDFFDLIKYFERVFGPHGQTPSTVIKQSVDSVLAKYGEYNRLSLHGFLNYHEDLATSNPNQLRNVSMTISTGRNGIFNSLSFSLYTHSLAGFVCVWV